MKIDMSARRKEHKLTQTELGEMCGVAQRTIAAYEKGDRRPSPEVAKKIGDALGLPWTAVYDGDSGNQ